MGQEFEAVHRGPKELIWKHLGDAELQRHIGEPTLRRLEPVLQALDPLGGVKVYGRGVLAKIFHSFVGVDLLADGVFRRGLLERLPRDVLAKVADTTGITGEKFEFGPLVERILEVGWRDESFIKKFMCALGLDEVYQCPETDGFQPVVELGRAEFPYKPLKDYQFAVHCDAMKRLDSQFARFLIQMPTGSGKTRTAMEFLSEVLNRSALDSLVVWVAHSEELCSQAVQCFSEVWSHVGIHSLKCYRCWGAAGRLPAPRSGRGIVFGGFQRLHSIQVRNPDSISVLASQIRLVVVDEAHKVMAPTYKAVCDALLVSQGKLVGLTATPGRSALGSDENRRLAEYFHNEIIQLPSEDGVSVIEMLRRRRILSRLISKPLVSSSSFRLSKQELEYLAESLDLSAGVLKSIGADDIRNVEIIKRLRQECSQGKRVIFFGCNVEHSRFVCALLTYFGVKAAHVDGQTGSMRRRTIIESYKRGETQVICNFGILTTGFDAPKTDVVFIARPTASVVLYSQMIGRGLRGPELGGTETCTLIDVRDNIDGFVGQTDLYSYFDEYWTAAG